MDNETLKTIAWHALWKIKKMECDKIYKNIDSISSNNTLQNIIKELSKMEDALENLNYYLKNK